MFRKLFNKMIKSNEKQNEIGSGSAYESHIHHNSTVTGTINSGLPTTTIAAPSIYRYIPSIPHSAYVSGGGGAVGAGGLGMYGMGSFSGVTMAPAPDPNIIALSAAGKEVVKLTKEGEVVWANGIAVNEAAEAFGKSIYLSAEIKAGIVQKTKCSIRDSVFNDLISIAKEKGSLTAEDLTYLLEASKIMERLKGIN